MVRKAALIAMLAVAGCQKSQADNASAMDLITLRSDLEMAKRRISAMEEHEQAQRELEEAILKRGEPGFSFVRSNVGGITVELLDISDAGGTARVKLRVGNASMATLAKSTVFGGWGALDKDGNPTGENHSLSAEITKPINAGSWNEVSFPINGAKAADVGYVRVYSINASTIILTKG